MLKLLVGPNDYAKQKYLDSAVNYTDQLNTIVLDEPTLMELVNHCTVAPLLSDHRDVVVLSDKKIMEDMESFLSFLPRLPMDTRLYILMDKAPTETALKPVQKEFNNIEGERNLLAYFKDAHRSMKVNFASSSASDAFFLFAGQSEMDIDNWLSHLLLMFPDKKVGVDDVRREVPSVREITPYNIIDYAIKGHLEYTFYLYENYVASGGDLVYLAQTLVYKLRQWLTYDWAVNHQKTLKREVADVLGVSAYVANILGREAALFNTGSLIGYFLDGVESIDEVMYEADSTRLRGLIRQMCIESVQNEDY
jgi:DNA polymerase III delta subunit